MPLEGLGRIAWDLPAVSGHVCNRSGLSTGSRYGHRFGRASFPSRRVTSKRELPHLPHGSLTSRERSRSGHGKAQAVIVWMLPLVNLQQPLHARHRPCDEFTTIFLAQSQIIDVDRHAVTIPSTPHHGDSATPGTFQSQEKVLSTKLFSDAGSMLRIQPGRLRGARIGAWGLPGGGYPSGGCARCRGLFIGRWLSQHVSDSERLCQNHPAANKQTRTPSPRTPAGWFRHGLLAQGLTVRLNHHRHGLLLPRGPAQPAHGKGT